jgi:hypothetical protein
MAIADSARTLPTAATMAYWRVEPRPKGARSLRPQLGRYPIPSLAVGAVYGDIMTSTPTHVVESWRTRYGAGTRSYEPGDRLPVEPGTRNACHVFSGLSSVSGSVRCVLSRVGGSCVRVRCRSRRLREPVAPRRSYRFGPVCGCVASLEPEAQRRSYVPVWVPGGCAVSTVAVPSR